MNALKNISLLGSMALLASASAFAAPITPQYDTFGKLDVTYGGTGIPNDPSAISYGRDGNGNVIMVNGEAGLTLGMIATPRGAGSPALTNDGAGTYQATSGAFAPPPGGDTNYALWNFNYFIGGANTGRYTFRLFYDMNPGANTEQSTMGFINLPAGQDSWNLGMNFLATDAAGVIDAPDFTNFNPTVGGEYGFALVAYSDGREVARSAILVDVPGANVPEPASLALAGIALLGAAVTTRRRRNKA